MAFKALALASIAAALFPVQIALAAESATVLPEGTLASGNTLAATAAGIPNEIIVTAQKRSETLQTVPIAISAYTADTRQLIGLETLGDYANFTPGLSYSAGSDRVFLRGVGRQTNIVGSDPGVATYSDGVYNSSTSSADGDELFVQRTEILRGPQGTLYGRNSIGGAIDVISRRPTDIFYGEARATVGNYGLHNFEGAVSGPVTDQVRLRLAAESSHQDEGYFKNVANGQTEGGRGHGYYVEGQMSVDFTPKLDGWIKVFDGAADTHPHQSELIGGYDYSPFPAGSLTPGNAFGFTTPGFIQLGAATVSPGLTNRRDFSDDVTSDSRTKNNWGLTTQLHFDGGWFDAKYVGGYQQYDYEQASDIDQTSILSYQYPLNPVFSVCNYIPGCKPLTVGPSQVFNYTERHKFYSQELDISSKGVGPIQWIVGGYYYNERFTQTDGFATPDQLQVFAPANGPANPSGDFVNAAGEIKTVSYAGFGQIDWKITDTLKLTGGLRYTNDQKSGVERFREICFGLPACGYDPSQYGSYTPALDITAAPTVISYAPAPGVVAPPTINAATGIASRQLSGSWNATTGTAGVEWTPDRSTMAYFKYSRGYKSGGFNTGAIIAAPETNPEYVDSYEVGVKKEFGHTLQSDAALFYYNYTGLQVPLTITPATGVPLTEFANIPSARSYGFEMESIWSPIQNLQFLLSYSYLDATVRKSSAAINSASPDGQTAVGQNLPDSPRNKLALNSNYTFKFDPGSLTFSASYIWKDQSYGYIFNRTYTEAPSYSQVDLRSLWTDTKNRYTVILYVRNLFDTYGYDDPVTVTGTSPTGPARQVNITAPRTFGVQLQYRFQ